MEIFLFKVQDYTTELIGQKYGDSGAFTGGFFVQRGDGTKYEYENYRVEWSKPHLQTIHNKDYAEMLSFIKLQPCEFKTYIDKSKLISAIRKHFA